MKEGKRILADPKFNFFDGTWDDRDIARLGHALYGIVFQDMYDYFRELRPGTYSLAIPKHICDTRRGRNQEFLRFRRKEQGVMSKKLIPFGEYPSKSRKLHKWLVSAINEHRRECEFDGELTKDECQFKIHSFLTISPTGRLCLWRITIKTRRNNQPLRFPILEKIDGLDAVANFKFVEALKIAGNMAFDECEMERREYSTVACKLSGMTRSSRKKK